MGDRTDYYPVRDTSHINRKNGMAEEKGKLCQWTLDELESVNVGCWNKDVEMQFVCDRENLKGSI